MLSAPAPLRVLEVPCRFRERVAGESKLDVLVLAQFAGLLLDKVFGGLLPLRFVSFALVGALGVLVNLAVLRAARNVRRRRSTRAQTIATIGRDDVQLPAQQPDHLSRPAAARRRGSGAGCCCSWSSAGSARSPISASRRRCMPQHATWIAGGRDGRGHRCRVELRGVGHAGLARALTHARRTTAADQSARAGSAASLALTALPLVALRRSDAPLASPDEAYYWVWSRALAAGYLDHPPMVALWIRAGTWIAGDTALGIRLLGAARRPRSARCCWPMPRDAAAARAAAPACWPRRC